MLYAQALINGVLLGATYGLMALGLSLIFGVLKIINFAHGTLMVVGMYASYWLFTLLGADPYLSLLPTAAFLFLVGFILQRYILNPIIEAPEEMSFLTTLGLGLIIQNLILMAFGPDLHTIDTSYKLSSFAIGDLTVDVSKLLAFGASLIVTGIFFSFLQWSETGRAIRAASDNREAATLMGIDTKKIYCVAFAIGAATTGAAGACFSTFIPTSQDVGHALYAHQLCHRHRRRRRDIPRHAYRRVRDRHRRGTGGGYAFRFDETGGQFLPARRHSFVKTPGAFREGR